MRERIEIFPGHWIEVTPKIKKNAGLRQSDRVVATLMGETVLAAGRLVRDGGSNVKYPALMLDEALRIAQEIGYTKAAKETGIHKESIVNHGRLFRKKLGTVRAREKGQRYTLAQKQACVRLAQQLMASKEVVTKRGRCYGKPYTTKRLRWSHGAAFKEAGRRLGLNGRSVEYMWIQGAIPLTQQPSGL